MAGWSDEGSSSCGRDMDGIIRYGTLRTAVLVLHVGVCPGCLVAAHGCSGLPSSRLPRAEGS